MKVTDLVSNDLIKILISIIFAICILLGIYFLVNKSEIIQLNTTKININNNKEKNLKTIFKLQDILGQIEIKSVGGTYLPTLLYNIENYKINGSKYFIGNINFDKLGKNYINYVNNNLYLSISSNGKYQLMFKFVENKKDKELIVSYPFKKINKKESFFINTDNAINKIINKNMKISKSDLDISNAIKSGGDLKRFADFKIIKKKLESYYNDNGEYPIKIVDLMDNLPKDSIKGHIINGCTFGYTYKSISISQIPNMGYRLSTCLEEKTNINKAKGDGGIYDNKYEIFKDKL